MNVPIVDGKMKARFPSPMHKANCSDSLGKPTRRSSGLPSELDAHPLWLRSQIECRCRKRMTQALLRLEAPLTERSPRPLEAGIVPACFNSFIKTT